MAQIVKAERHAQAVTQTADLSLWQSARYTTCCKIYAA